MKFTTESGCFRFWPKSTQLVYGFSEDSPVLRVQLGAEVVQGRDAGIPAAGQVQRGKVQGQAQDVVPQGVGDELVEFGTDLVRHAHGDGACGLLRVQGACRAGVVRRGVEEGVQQRHADVCAVVGLPVDRFGQHRVPEPVGGVGEFRLDRGVDAGVRLREHVEAVDAGLDLASKVLEDDVLVFHLRDVPRRLEQAFTVPLRPLGASTR